MLDMAPSFRFLWWIVILTLIGVYFYNWYKRPQNFPPGPRGIPFLGVLPFMRSYPERVLKRWSKKYGPIMSVRFGPEDVIILNDFESIQKVRISVELLLLQLFNRCNNDCKS